MNDDYFLDSLCPSSRGSFSRSQPSKETHFFLYSIKAFIDFLFRLFILYSWMAPLGATSAGDTLTGGLVGGGFCVGDSQGRSQGQ